MGANGVYLVGLVKSIPITINRSVLETVFGLKFTKTTPPSSAEATALQVPLPEQPTLLALRDSLERLGEDYVELRTQVDLIHSNMGLLGKKLDELIRMTCTIHHGARFSVTFTSSDLDPSYQEEKVAIGALANNSTPSSHSSSLPPSKIDLHRPR
ncbi:hypothetical protein Cgig2_010904 [Carnegiea gigantea]|uniref:Uncharacterized protein n=1 Tax=Carnegiea gigantea TaxID=171969 RepID=A0A9Q1JMB3_9CARY|nr:hypothetical protein Cgig2_010904 [Carnegiea gigantea]